MATPWHVPFCLDVSWCCQWSRSPSHVGSNWTGAITREGMWHPPYHFLGDARGCSAIRGVIIQQLRCVREARAGFSSLQRWQESRQGRAGHWCCPPPLSPWLLPKKTHPQGTDLAFCRPKLEMKVLHILQHVKTLYKPFSHLAALQDLLQTFQGCKAEWCFPMGFSPQAGGWSGRKRICATSPF